MCVPDYVHKVVDTLPINLHVPDFKLRRRAEISRLVVHHTVAGALLPPELIAGYHTRSRGWPGIGYHFYVTGDGSVYQCNRLTTVSYHAGSYNRSSVGIAFAGDFTALVPAAEQIAAGAALLAWLLAELKLAPDCIVGHRELPFAQTACPGDQWLGGGRWKDTLLREVLAAPIPTQEVPVP